MPEMYRVPLHSGALQQVRTAAGRLDLEDCLGAGLDSCRVFFSGTFLLLRLDGPGGLLERLRASRTGGTFLDVLERTATFDPSRQVVHPVGASDALTEAVA